MELIPLSPLVSLFSVLAEPLAGALAVIVGCTTLLGGVGHYSGVLLQKPKARVEAMTGAGFFCRVNGQLSNSVSGTHK